MCKREIMECVSLVDGGKLFNKNFNQWTSMNIFVYKMVLFWLLYIFYDLLDPLLSEDSSKKREFGTER